jgi:hypothetical protein
MASRLEPLQSDVHYCYQYFDWVVGEDWEPHCQSHLAGMAIKLCGTITYCHKLVRPSYCPFCMSDPELFASKRLESRTRDHKLWSHANEHFGKCRWPRVCPYPLCDTTLKDAASFQFHLVDEYGFSRQHTGYKCIKVFPNKCLFNEQQVLRNYCTFNYINGQFRDFVHPKQLSFEESDLSLYHTQDQLPQRSKSAT